MKNLIYKLTRWTMGTVFIYAGSIKLLEPKPFVMLIEAYGVVPEGLLIFVAIVLPALEVLAGIGLLFDIEGSLAVIAGLLVLFLAVLIDGVWMGLDIDCGCFGPEDPEGKAFHGLRPSLYRDLVMLSVVAFMYAWRRYRAVKPIKIIQLISKLEKRRKKMRMFKSFPKSIILMFLVVGLAAPAAAFLENKFEKEVEKEAGAVKLVREVQRGGYNVVFTEELKQWIDSGKDMVIVDTMPFADSYKKQHVPGAVQFLFPVPEMSQWDTNETDGRSQEDFIKLLGDNKNKTIVIYCGFVKCTRSHNGAAWAIKLGYKNVYRYPGGIFAWKGAKYPVEKAE